MNTNKQGKHIQKSKKKYLLIILVIIFIILVSYLGYLVYMNIRDKQMNRNLQEEIENANTNINTNETATSEIDKAGQEVINKVKELQLENEEVKGWIQINDTKINYPLLQSKDNEFYLNRNYKKEKSNYGSIFIDKDSDLNNINSNVIIYGHNMKDGEMFQNLMNYTDKAYYDTHKIINIYTNSESRQYEIATVFKSRVFYQNETNVFRYYYCTDLSTEEKYKDYIENCKKLALYDTGINASMRRAVNNFNCL